MSPILKEIENAIATTKALAKKTSDEYTRRCIENAIGFLHCARRGIKLAHRPGVNKIGLATVPAAFRRHLQ